MMQGESEGLAAEDRKRKRLENWRRRQQSKLAPVTKVSLALTNVKVTSKKAGTDQVKKNINPFFNDSDSESEQMTDKRPKKSVNLLKYLNTPSPPERSKNIEGRWDNSSKDLLDQFMDQLSSRESMTISAKDNDAYLSIDASGSMMRKKGKAFIAPTSGSAIAAEDIMKFQQQKAPAENNFSDGQTKPFYQPKDWLSDGPSDTDDENEEEGRRALINALKSAPAPISEEVSMDNFRPAQTAEEVRSEKTRREEHIRQLEDEADHARKSALRAENPEVGRLYVGDTEDGIMEEAERNLQAAMAAPDALTVLAELNKKKELKSIDHSKVEYIPFQKNLYRVPRSLASLTNDEVVNLRAKLKVRVRGSGAPAPVRTFTECGLSEKIIEILNAQKIFEPYPVQAQCIPCIMAGRDVIGIAKTGSGKTLAYLLPMLRHILVQPPLGPQESGPIGLILAPARELAYQIYVVSKKFAKSFGLKSTAVYGGAGVAEQIGDLKRGAHIVVATPGRLIDILTMQSGKILSLQRVSFVVLDEADRMYDMGFAPQMSAILGAIRPDRQTVLFSATFPKAIETLARKSLKYPVEVVVGGRSIASDNVTQYAGLVEEDDKFLRLLQILGEQVEGVKKAIVFVDTQVRADSLFEQLLRNGYLALSLHGGKEQEDRDSTISDFKQRDGSNVLVATGVAGRGLDVPACSCVVNYSAPSHLEAYVHQTGRTGRANNKGVCYTFVNSTDEAKYAPTIVRALSEAGQSERISPELKKLSDEYKTKVERGEARYAGNGFKGRGYTYDANEMTEAQKMAHIEKRQVLIEAGLLDPEDEDPFMSETVDSRVNKTEADHGEVKIGESRSAEKKDLEIPENLTPELLALPGMKEALLRKAGILPAEDSEDGDKAAYVGAPVRMGDDHWLQEFEINDYPREARWKVTQKDTTSRLQDEFHTAVTLKGSHFAAGREPKDGERRLYLHLEATSEQNVKKCVLEIQRILNEETLRVGAKSSGGASASHKYNVLG